MLKLYLEGGSKLLSIVFNLERDGLSKNRFPQQPLLCICLVVFKYLKSHPNGGNVYYFPTDDNILD